eukprot:1814758-Rhodomonas_salina.1
MYTLNAAQRTRPNELSRAWLGWVWRGSRVAHQTLSTARPLAFLSVSRDARSAGSHSGAPTGTGA